jgi:excisionase family DNA binding protein
MTAPESKPERAEAILSTRDVARLLVVSEATVKRWADDGLLSCYRTPGGHRKFTNLDVSAFMEARGFHGGAGAPVPEPSPGEVLRLARTADVGALERLAVAALERGMPLEAYLDTIVIPALVDIGDRWACAEATIAEEHVVSFAIGEFLARVRARLERTEARRGTAIVACAAADRHDLASRMASLVLRSRGWHIIVTGADTPAADVAKLALTTGARVVAYSASEIGAGPFGAVNGVQAMLRPSSLRGTCGDSPSSSKGFRRRSSRRRPGSAGRG